MGAYTGSTENITSAELDAVARKLQADPTAPESAVFFNLTCTDLPYNEALRKKLYSNRQARSIMKEVGEQDYLQAYGRYLFENMATEWDSSTYSFPAYVDFTTRTHGAFCYQVMKDSGCLRMIDDPKAKEEASGQPGKTSGTKRKITVKVRMENIDDRDSCIADPKDSIGAVERHMLIDSLFRDLKLEGVTRLVTEIYLSDGNSVHNRRRNSSVPYDYIRSAVLAEYGVELTNAQIAQKIRYGREVIRQRVGALNEADYSFA